MRISSKILWATLPLLLMAFVAASGVTYFLSREALREIAAEWLETRGEEAVVAARAQAEFLAAYQLDGVEASVRQAKGDAAAMMADVEIGESGFVFVIDAEGRIAHHPDPALVGADVSAEPWFAAMRAEGDGRLSYGFRGERFLAAFLPYDPWGWTVVATAPETEVYGAVNRLGVYVLVLGLLGAAFIAAVQTAFTRRLTVPLGELVRGAERVGRGELDTELSVRTDDEVGQLAASFNTMTRELRSLYDRLEERLTKVVANAPIAVLSVGGDGRVTLLEGKGLDALGLDASRALGRHADEALGSAGDIAAAVNRAQGGETVNEITRIGDKVFEIWCAPLSGRAGSVAGAIGVATDVTERVRAEERLLQQTEYLEALTETSLGVISRLDVDELLQIVITRAGELIDAPHGFVYLADDDGASIRRRIGAGVYGLSVGFRLCPGQGVAGKVWTTGEPVTVNDYESWPERIPNRRYDGFIRALLGVPLKSGDEIIGVLGLAYGTGSDRRFGEDEARLLSRFAELASISLDNARLFAEAEDARRKAEAANERVLDKNRMLESLSSQLSKYLSPQVYASIFTGSRSVELSARRKKLTVFFSDIAGFTEIADRLESEELTELLNHYLTEMSTIALEHGATIDKYVGDAIVVFFGDPESRGVKEDALACIRMAIAMRDRLEGLEEEWRASGVETPLRCRIGVNTGYCTVGNFGSENRMDYTIIGGGVNLASRLETSAEPGEILISYETWAHVKDEIRCEEYGEVSVKGIAYPVTTYRVIGLRGAAGEQPRRLSERRPHFSLDADIDAMTANQRRDLAALLKSISRSIRNS